MSPGEIVGLVVVVAAVALFLLVLYSIFKVSGECSEREMWMDYGRCKVRKGRPTAPRPNIKPRPQKSRNKTSRRIHG